MSQPQQAGMAPPQYSQGQHQHQVIIMTPAPVSPKLDTYHGKAAVILGIIQIILGVLMIGIYVMIILHLSIFCILFLSTAKRGR